VDVEWPPGPHGVVIVYPHTSNWDFPVGYLARLAAALPLSWLGKDSLFRGPAGAVFRRMGGIPVQRGVRAGAISALAQEFTRRPWLWIALAPEGTRAFTDHWKSGFYHLARAAGVPVGVASIDWARRRVTLRDYLTLSGDPAVDLARFRDLYRGMTGYHPAQASTIRFRGDERERT
jgi:1-acyl-sn-glycerol-3-phosphate acyltransferase